MFDLVERLRDEGLGFGIGPALVCQQAADEIVRLRAELEKARTIDINAQTESFAAGVEAAAIIAEKHAADLLDKAEFYQPPRTDADPYLSDIHEQAAAGVYQVVEAIRNIVKGDGK